jgi:hypothetical protein
VNEMTLCIRAALLGLVSWLLVSCHDTLPQREFEAPPSPPCSPARPFGPIELPASGELSVGRCGDVLAQQMGGPGLLWRAADGRVLELEAGPDDWSFTDDGHWLIARSGFEVRGLYAIAEDRFDPFESGDEETRAGVSHSKAHFYPGDPLPSLFRGRCDAGEVRLAALTDPWPTLADPVFATLDRCHPFMWDVPEVVVDLNVAGTALQLIDLSRRPVSETIVIPDDIDVGLLSTSQRSNMVGSLIRPIGPGCPDLPGTSRIVIFARETGSERPAFQVPGGAPCDRQEAVRGGGQRSMAWVIGQESVWVHLSGEVLRLTGELIHLFPNDREALLRVDGGISLVESDGQQRVLLDPVQEVIPSPRHEAFAFVRVEDAVHEVWIWRRGAEPRRVYADASPSSVLWVSDAGDTQILSSGDGQVVRLQTGSPPSSLARGVQSAGVTPIVGRDPVLWLQFEDHQHMAVLRGDALEVLAEGNELTSVEEFQGRAVAARVRRSDGSTVVYGGRW